MAVYIQEHRIINTPKSICEERLTTIAIKGYTLRNNRVIDSETVITLETRNAFSSNGQRITIALKDEDEKTTGVSIRSELISNIQLKDRGANQKNIDTIYKYLEMPKQAEDGSAADEDPELSHKDQKRSKKKFNWLDNTRSCQMRMMATYLGGHNDLKKALKGSLEIYTDGFEFCVLGPKLNIPASFIQDVKACGNSEIRENPEWLASCFKNTQTKIKSIEPKAKEKKTKIVVSFLNEGISDYCIFNADSQLSGEADAAKAEVLIRKLIII